MEFSSILFQPTTVLGHHFSEGRVDVKEHLMLQNFSDHKLTLPILSWLASNPSPTNITNYLYQTEGQTDKSILADLLIIYFIVPLFIYY